MGKSASMTVRGTFISIDISGTMHEESNKTRSGLTLSVLSGMYDMSNMERMPLKYRNATKKATSLYAKTSESFPQRSHPLRYWDLDSDDYATLEEISEKPSRGCGTLSQIRTLVNSKGGLFC